MSVGVVRKATSVKWPQPTLRPAELRTFRSSHHARARMGSDHQDPSRFNAQRLCTGGNLSYALLVMDVQQAVVDIADDDSGYLPRLRRAIDGARAVDIPVTYVVIGQFPGFPEVGTRNKALLAIAQAGLFVEGASGTEIHPEVAPWPGDVVVTKRRASARITARPASPEAAYGLVLDLGGSPCRGPSCTTRDSSLPPIRLNWGSQPHFRSHRGPDSRSHRDERSASDHLRGRGRVSRHQPRPYRRLPCRAVGSGGSNEYRP
ncbi:Isochorismatase family protein [Streptomyces sp. ADI95-17]|nr:Isochorismatase family protein [Streptomyces sp. ADI95-17]